MTDIARDAQQAEGNGAPAKLATRLREQILRGIFQDGQRLPSERQLAEDNAVSRGTVREALRLLEQGDLLSRKRGSGSYVTYPAEQGGPEREDVAEITSPLQLLEVRLALEPQMVRLASRNMTARDIAGLEEALRNTEAAKDEEIFSHWDKIFHLRIAEGTRNPLMITMYGQINHVRTHDLWESIKGAILTPERIRQYNAHHREVFDAIRRRDPEAAVACMNNHLLLAQQDLVVSPDDGAG
ncbi:MAG: FadR family transcriptional regulator [Rhodospirillaceae bacterium]|nr:FadR family transcriptional regulator [Rhodospirillaceae bacterium]MBT3626854.1 FadR family transcriptional regulator [Rhodospirillaceae bacterium]MBT4425438.1 FadR family transcriptional regulator [Rhodospirillaceae bacterium]MBT5779942.1 FadR family transcriptional regulator [Rhodospirillaceae bacterium]MBT6831281.1 FadR family transcriptional regulator [Rhodospirillaceae bacterium]